MENKFKKRIVTPEKALVKLMTLCSRSEKSTFDALMLLKRWEVESRKAEEIVARLVKEKYIDDKRYCDAYVREKARLSSFGEQKIKQFLTRKRIKQDIIQNSLDTFISKDKMKEKLQIMLDKKRKELEKKEDDSYKIREKLVRFALSRGYDYQIISDVLS